MAHDRLTSPPAAQLVLRIGVTGHRPNRLAEADKALLRTRIREVLALVCKAVQDGLSAIESTYASGPPIIRLISPLAEGADRIVAQEALEMGFELQCPLPFDRTEYEKDFDTPESRDAYHVMLAKATAVLELDGSRETVRREQEAYEAVGRMVLRQCDVLIAIWDGKEAEAKGGTGQIVEEAALLDIPTVWIQSCPPHDAYLRVRKADGRIQDVGLHELPTRLSQLLLPPASPSPDLRQAYFLETQRHRTLGFLFKAVRDLIAAGRPGRLEWRLQDFEDATRAEWQQIWQVSPGFPQTVIEQINARFRSHYAWADKLADYYANLYRSSFVANYLMGGLAVLFALLAYVSPGYEKVWIWLELILILCIIINTSLGTRQRWHERWIDYRLLAEQLRQMRFLAPLGRALPSFRVPAHYAQANPSNTWVNWHFRAIARAAGMVNARLDPSYLEAYRQLLTEHEIQSQVAYHRDNAHRSHTIHRRLHMLGYGLFFLTSGACVLHLWSHSLWLTFFAAVFPAFGAAAYGIRSHGEFQRIAERSEAMSQRLQEMADQLRNPEYMLSSHALGQMAEAAADIMTTEVLDWRIVFRAKPLVLPS
jgi:Protein of unknown function (DUF4231)